MNHPVKVVPIVVEENPPPPYRPVPPVRPKVHYPFDKIPVGQAARFPRTISAVRKALTAYKRHPDHPERMNQRFRVKEIGPHQTRVWRTK